METTASLIAIVTLCEQVIKYINATAGAKDDRQRLRLQIRTCSNFIHELKDQAEDPEQTEEWAKLMQLLSGPLARLHEALSLAAQSLSSRDSTVEKLKWPFKEKDVRKLVEAVKCETDLLSLAFDRNTTRLLHEITLRTQHNEQLLTELKTSLVVCNIDQKSELTRIEKYFQRVQISQHGVQERVQLLHERYDLEEASEKRQSILEWLTPIDHASHQRDAIRRRQPGTGQWFLDSPQYQDWVSGKNRTLFCPGIPGAGKTVLASIINDDLWKRYHADSRVGLAHLFFDYRRQDQQSSEALLSGLLKQLVEKQASLPKPVEDFYEMQHQRASDRTRATLDILGTVIADFSKVFIVLDAIDECISPGEIRTELLCVVQQLQGKCGLNLLATSRDVPEITERFAAASVLQIRAHAEDVQRYLYGQVQRLPSFVHRSISLQEEVVSSIVKAVQGMFLLAKLHIDSLVGKRSPKALRASLNNLATGSQAYDAAYEAAMLRIRSQPGDLKELAIQTLTFLTCTKHRFSEVDLQTVLATEFGESYIDPENFPDIDDVLTACIGLVTIDNESAVIRLTHYTTQEYLKRTQQRWFPDAQAIIADTCLSFLLSEYEKPVVLELWGHESWYKYSAINWGHHARVAPSVHLRMMELLSQSAVVQNNLVSLRDQSLVFYEYFWKRPISRILLSGLHLAAYFGLESATVLLLDEENGHSLELAERDVNRQMALFVAIQQGHEAIVKQLLLRGTPIHPLVDTSLLDREDIALHLAMGNGHHHILKLLLDEGCPVNLRDMTGCTALHSAVEGQHIPSVKLLLEAHADVDAQDVDLITPLHIAAEYPDSTILKMLLEHGAKVNMADCAGQTALQVAVYQGLFSSAKLLLDYKADVNTASQKFDTPLHKAAISGDARTLSLLLDYGGAVELRNHDGNTALHHAVLSEDTPSVRILLENKSDVNAANLERETPLNYATRIKDPTILGLLLEFGAAVDTLNPEGNSALMNACFWLTEPQAHVDLLIAAGANICVLDNMNCSTLIWAMKHDPRPALLRFLLRHGADPNLGLPPLSYAELQLEELVTHNALFGLSPNQCVEKQNWEECIQVLKEAGAQRDPEFPQKWKVRF